ncbi:hypothetical protein [Streptomyces sp. TBY4]|uniref:hypothetical protein n=1 Tax=Streptomyces sp. TBY4 TaxID=2962030 RepID=UPI0020B89759|nr:hypothetical protein [Streptomyces sp. TBY4]MCP3754001.1 hypothetical protein [Streptomyces sp. TBY4]
MRRRILGFTAALALAVLGTSAPGAQAAVPVVTGPECVRETVDYGKGSVEYDSSTGLWTCIGGRYDGEPITTS